ncbi:MAG: carboxypeptidase-like regulatory domain-containing protein, partial [Bacteroidota bacterium]
MRKTRGEATAGGLVLVTALGFLLAGCGGGGAPPPPQTATIIGYVVDQAGGSAIEGATVVLQEIGPSSTPITATTGNDGKFQFTNLPPAP